MTSEHRFLLDSLVNKSENCWIINNLHIFISRLHIFRRALTLNSSTLLSIRIRSSRRATLGEIKQIWVRNQAKLLDPAWLWIFESLLQAGAEPSTFILSLSGIAEPLLGVVPPTPRPLSVRRCHGKAIRLGWWFRKVSRLLSHTDLQTHRWRILRSKYTDTH